MRFLRTLILASAPLVPLLASSRAGAQPVDRPDQTRVVGLGTAFGAGFERATFLSSTGRAAGSLTISPAGTLPSLEIQAFLPHGYAIDVSIPVGDMILWGAWAHTAYFQADVFFDPQIGHGNTRLVLGPGIGFAIADVSGSAGGSIRFPAEIGFQAMNRENDFSFGILARPWVDLTPGSPLSSIGAGAVFLLDFMGYVTRPRR